MRSPEEHRFKRAAAEFWKDPKLDITEQLIVLPFPEKWTLFDLDKTGNTFYRGLYKDEDIGVYLFRSEEGGEIAPHWHRFPERVVFIRGSGSLVLNRDFEEPVELSVDRSVLIPAATLHQGGNFKHAQGMPSLSLCVFYYGLLTD